MADVTVGVIANPMSGRDIRRLVASASVFPNAAPYSQDLWIGVSRDLLITTDSSGHSMSLPFLNTAPGYDEELRNSVFFERGLHATSICGAVGAAVAVAMLQGQDEATTCHGPTSGWR